MGSAFGKSEPRQQTDPFYVTSLPPPIPTLYSGELGSYGLTRTYDIGGSGVLEQPTTLNRYQALQNLLIANNFAGRYVQGTMSKLVI